MSRGGAAARELIYDVTGRGGAGRELICDITG